MHLIQQIEELEVEMHRLRESGEETTAQLELLERGKKKTEAEIKEKEAALKLADQRAEERRAELDNVRKVRKRHQVSVKAFFFLAQAYWCLKAKMLNMKIQQLHVTDSVN